MVLTKDRLRQRENPHVFTSITQKTANSQSGNGVFVQISGFGLNPVKYTDPDGKTPRDSKQFFSYTMGSDIGTLVTNVKFTNAKGKRAGSMPWGTIYIPLNDSYQGGYNPGGDKGAPPTDLGQIGLETHELWHQVQYKQSGLKALFGLIGEQLKYKGGNGYPYIQGNPVLNPSILTSIDKISDISTYEGQAQFIGQWNADVYEYLTGGNVDMSRLKREAKIILNSGFNSKAASDIILLDYNRG
jgi:hypothetical protein